jgi:hypothetical protein
MVFQKGLSAADNIAMVRYYVLVKKSGLPFPDLAGTTCRDIIDILDIIYIIPPFGASIFFPPLGYKKPA